MPENILSFDEAYEYLNTVADGIPPEILKDLNGGIVLLPDLVPSPEGEGLYILGTYHYDPYGLGRYVAIHYGSFAAVHRWSPRARQKQALKEVLYHELTHHIESLAGVRDLEVKDELFLEQFRREHGETDKPRGGKKYKTD